MIIMSKTLEKEMISFLERGALLRYIPCQTDNICETAILLNPYNIEDVEKIYATEELKQIAVNLNGLTLKYIENPSERTKIMALKNNGDAIEFIEEPTDEMKYLAIHYDGTNIRFIKKPTTRMKEIAIKQNVFAKKYIKD